MKVEVNTDAMGRDIARLQAMSRKLKASLQELDGSMRSLQQCWEGAAKNAYLEEYAADQTAMQELCGMLEEFIRAIEDARRKYQNCEQKVESCVSQLG